MNSLIFSSIVTLSVIIYLWLKKKPKESILIFLFCASCIMMTLYFFEVIGEKYEIFNGKGELAMDATGQVGDFIGGIIGTLVAAVSIVLLYKTLTAQRETSNNQASEFIKTQNENRFFELLSLHRDNVTEIEFEYSTSVDEKPKLVRARHFFVTVNDQLEIAFNEFQCFIDFYGKSLEDIYEEKYLNQLKLNSTFIERNIDYYIIAKIDICYLIIFFGVSQRGSSEILEVLKDKYKLAFLNELLQVFQMKPSKSSKHFKTWKTLILENEFLQHIEVILQERKNLNNAPTKRMIPYGKNGNYAYYPNNYVKYYGGHRFRLGHYFRHLYQLVCFVHHNDDLPIHEKKSYTRIIRGQLSDYEQILFFYNSLSQLGRVWELENNHREAISKESHLISKYNLVKNISKIPLLSNIRTHTFYPSKSNER